MKSYDELKAVIEIIQQRVKDTKYKSKLVLKEVNRLRKKFEFIAPMLKGSLAKGWKAW